METVTHCIEFKNTGSDFPQVIKVQALKSAWHVFVLPSRLMSLDWSACMFIAHTQYVYSCKLCHIQLASLNQLLNRASYSYIRQVCMCDYALYISHVHINTLLVRF